MHEFLIPFILMTTALRQSIVVKILIVIKHRCLAMLITHIIACRLEILHFQSTQRKFPKR